MLRLITGRAGTGKTAAVIDEIKQNMLCGKAGSIMIVPEQYSHEAERELCLSCGDALSLYAEVLSFTGLARKLSAKQGGAAVQWLDKGGRLLCMALALQGVGSRLRVYSNAQRKPELQNMLLMALDELKSGCISSEMLLSAAAECNDSLGDKLSDLALILEAYNAAAANGHADPSDRLTLLARQIKESDMDAGTRVYVDGFIDFTRQEREILSAMLKKNVTLTVCLTLDSLDGDNEIFELSRRAGRELAAAAKELGQETEVISMDERRGKDAALSFFADNMFSYSDTEFDGGCRSVRLMRCESMAAECEQAAALCLAFVRDKGCRWRDISVVARGFDDYAATLESVFRHYGVPLFTAAKSEVMAKPLPALIEYAYEIINGGWAVDDVICYMRTMLAGLDEKDCDLLESYIYKWQLRGSAWRRRGDWRQHPDGYGAEYTEETEELLKKINELRHTLSLPLAHFEKASGEAHTASEQAKALTGLFAELKLPETLSRRADELTALGREKDAAEYRQLWDICVNALEQCDAVLGESAMERDEFARLFTLMLSKYDIGTIPVSLDRVSAGDFDRCRRRSIKHLIVLGVTDGRIPRAEDAAGLFSGDERRRLTELELPLSAGGDSELWREFLLIYNCFTMPSDTLTMLYPMADSAGEEQRSAFVFNRAAAIFGIKPENADISDARMSAPAPALGVAAEALRGGGAREEAVARYFERREPERFAALKAASGMTRGRLSPEAVNRLYGRKLRLTASRIDKFASCRFAYFCQYGLKAKPYEPIGFQPPEIGTFMHYVLENTARDVESLNGFKNVDDEKLKEISERYIEKYISEELNDFREKSRRFEYLFRRVCRDVHAVVKDMADELRRSEFAPLDFELDFSKATELGPPRLGENGDSVTLSGIADRVDGWLHDGKLYIRVVDYKTGKKEFSLSDVWYGMGLQMLMYLFVLENSGDKRYGHEIAPAGVMYLPARSPMLNLDKNESIEAVLDKRMKELRRSGLVLDDESVQEAWEHGAEKLYIPVKLKNGKPDADSVASAERLGVLGRHIKRSLNGMAAQLRQGSIAADPYYRSQQENACLNCDYYDACHFADGENGEKCRTLPKLGVAQVWELMEEEDGNG